MKTIFFSLFLFLYYIYGFSQADYKHYQDSLRTEILKTKENIILKQSVLDELYVRNLIIVSGDSAQVVIPFNLHGLDCGAPDCYSTEISFSIFLSEKTINFPQKLKFKEYEGGCVPYETIIEDTFFLLKQTSDHIIYYCPTYKRSLVIFSYKGALESGSSAFYIVEASENTLNDKDIYSLIEYYDETNKDSIEFYMSTLLNCSYEDLLEI